MCWDETSQIFNVIVDEEIANYNSRAAPGLQKPAMFSQQLSATESLRVKLKKT